MLLIFKTALLQLSCIIIFAFIYYFNNIHFEYNEKEPRRDKFIDFLLLSTTIQASIGFSGINPITDLGKFIVIIHQMLVTFFHILTIYVLKFYF
jgi:hypothetical protein